MSSFKGWFRKRDGTWSFGLKCTPGAMKDFREAIKEKTPKTHMLSLAALVDRVNPTIMGKAAYWAQAAKAVQLKADAAAPQHCSGSKQPD